MLSGTSSTQFWDPEKDPLICIDKTIETADTVSFLFSSQHQAQFQFHAGQFISLQVNIEEKTLYRAYSISSVPNQDTLRLTIKRVSGGIVSNWLIDNLKVNDNINALAPAGDFHLQANSAQEKVLLISAGCGITPVMSMALSLLQDNSQADINFIHCAKDSDNIIYASTLAELEEKHPNFQLHYVLKHQQDETYFKARCLDEAYFKELCPDYQTRHVFLCGPSTFMDFISDTLRKNQFDMSRFKQELFTPICDTQAPPVIQEEVTIDIPAFSKSTQVSVGSNLLEALEEEGIPIIGACRSGVCGSCKCKVKGKVRTTSRQPLTPQEIEDGYYLACSTFVEGDVEVNL